MIFKHRVWDIQRNIMSKESFLIEIDEAGETKWLSAYPDKNSSVIQSGSSVIPFCAFFNERDYDNTAIFGGDILIIRDVKRDKQAYAILEFDEVSGYPYLAGMPNYPDYDTNSFVPAKEDENYLVYIFGNICTHTRLAEKILTENLGWTRHKAEETNKIVREIAMSILADTN